MRSHSLPGTIRLCALMGCLLAALPPARGSTRVDLNGPWQFRTDPSKQGEEHGWTRQLPAETATVRVPHTWNLGKYEDYEGTAWYFKSFAAPTESRGKHVELHFGATFYRSRIWLNGVELGGHEGGHTAYFFDITPHLKPGNFLAVEINNQPTTESIPGWAMKLRDSHNLWYDWWHYGGIVRDVWLSVSEPALIRRQEIRVKVDGTTAFVTDRIFLENFDSKPIEVSTTTLLATPEGASPASLGGETAELRPGKQIVTDSFRIEHAERWDFDHPKLYRLTALLMDKAGRTLDSLTDNFGVRSVEIRDRKLYLNGEPVRLSGMARHEDSPWEGLAESVGTIKHDYDDMKNLQMTLTRPVHYPQNPAILDYCDRNGILLIPEIPMWQFSEKQMSDPKVIALAKQMMREMIEQDYNHPSIFAWSTCNESATDTPGGRAYFKTMYHFIKQLDPGRYVSYADDRIVFVDNPAEDAASMADFIMWNQYFGSWHGPEEDLPAAIAKINRNYPDKMVIISEFGFAGTFARDSKAGDKQRVRIFREQMAQFGKEDWIAGALMWCYQDYLSHRNLWPGYTKGYVDIGVVDENRQRRPSYYVWKELNSPAHVELEWHYDAHQRPVGFGASIARRGPDEIPSYALRDYRVAWEVRDNDNTKIAGDEKALPEIGPPQSLVGSWPASASKSLRLILRLYRPTGFVAAEKTLDWWEARSGGLNVEDMKRQGITVPE
jgi:beta-galactosidase/beta-glucuronidase